MSIIAPVIGDWYRNSTGDLLEVVALDKSDATIEIQYFDGTVEEIGWRMNCNRTFDQRPLYVPNAIFSQISIQNPSRMRNRRIYETIGIRYDDIDRVDVITALKAMTIWPAWQHFEENDKGSIEVGKLADFVILSKDPTAVDPETLAELEVRETIKEGKSIYKAGVREGRLQYRPRPGGADPYARFLHTLALAREVDGMAAELARFPPDRRAASRSRKAAMRMTE